jgi:hypothetical protein
MSRLEKGWRLMVSQGDWEQQPLETPPKQKARREAGDSCQHRIDPSSVKHTRSDAHREGR